MILERKWFLILVLLALQFLDVATTLTVIGLGGTEANPIMRNVAHGDPWAFLGVKVMVVVGLAFIVRDIHKKGIVLGGLAFVVLAYFAIVGWNLYNLNTVIGA